MSDGPHRSLPMRRHWRDLAERAAMPVYDERDVSEALRVALKKDFREAPISMVLDILRDSEQSTLFDGELVSQLDATRRACRGSAAGNALVDCAIGTLESSLKGEAALRSALGNAIYAYANNGCRQIEEHFLRELPKKVSDLRARLSAAVNQCRYENIASEIMSGISTTRDGRRLQKRTGVDDGPRL